MKHAILTSLIFLTSTLEVPFALALPSVITSAQMAEFEKQTRQKLGETRPMESAGYCEAISSNRVQCLWYIAHTGRTSDTMNAIFEETNGEFVLVDAFEEYGC